MQRMKGTIMWAVTIAFSIGYKIFLEDAEMPILLISMFALAILLPLSFCTMFWEIKAKYDDEDAEGYELTWLKQNRGIAIIAVASLSLVVWPLTFILYPIGCIHLFFDIKRKYYY